MPPGVNDIAQFDSGTGLIAATTFTLGLNTSWSGVSVVAPGAAIVIGGGADNVNTLTLGAMGVNMSMLPRILRFPIHWRLAPRQR